MPMRKNVIVMPATAPPPSLLRLLVLPELLEVGVTPKLVDDEECPGDVTTRLDGEIDVTVGPAGEEGTSFTVTTISVETVVIMVPGSHIVGLPSGDGTKYPEVVYEVIVVIVDNIFKFQRFKWVLS